jgi:predicted alpha/beta-fold hydrolase
MPPPLSPPTFTPAWWLPGGHAQTIWVRACRHPRAFDYQREVLPTPDGDELVLDHAAGPAGAPRVLLLHGLEGSSYSLHMTRLAGLVTAAGARVTLLNFRSCARDPRDVNRRFPNRRPRLYHSGETGDLDFVVSTLVAREPATPLGALGISLGGNVLLKWLGERGAGSSVRAAAALSVPYDLGTASTFLERRVGSFYVEHFLRTLREKALEVLARFPREAGQLSADRIRAARTFAAFDDSVTAPLHGFGSAAEYYDRSSSLHFLSRIAVPTLCLSAADDPFSPEATLPRARLAASSVVDFQVTPRGGHVGWVAGRWPLRPRYWGEQQAVAFVLKQLQNVPIASAARAL